MNPPTPTSSRLWPDLRALSAARQSEREAMLSRIGVPDIDALFADIPADKRIQGLLDMPLAMSEMAVERAMTAIANRSVAAGSVPFFLGSGAYRRHIPATVDHLIQRSEFLTSYTPYQPEIAQGTLQVLLSLDRGGGPDRHGGRERVNVRRLDRMRRGDADGPSADPTQSLGVSGGLHPQYADVCATLAHMAGDRIVRLAPDLGRAKTSPRRSMTRRAA